MGRTSIQVSDELADELHGRKQRGETYEDVIWSLIEGDDDEQPTHAREEDTPAYENPFRDVTFPGTVDRRDGVEAVFAVRDYLKEQGKATRAQIVKDVMPEYPIVYDVPDDPKDYRGSWWRKVVKPGLEALDVVEKPPKGGSDWKYVG